MQALAREKKISEEDAAVALLSSQRKKKKGTFVEVLAKQVQSDFSYAMVSCEQHTKEKVKDFTIFLVYDHR